MAAAPLRGPLQIHIFPLGRSTYHAISAVRERRRDAREVEAPSSCSTKTAPVALLSEIQQFLVLEAFDVPRFRLVFRSRPSSLSEVVGGPRRPHLIELDGLVLGGDARLDLVLAGAGHGAALMV